MRWLSRALVAAEAVLVAACGQPKAPQPTRAPEVKIPLAPPAPSGVTAAEPALRFMGRLNSDGTEVRFHRDAGVITPCEQHEEGCMLDGQGRIVPASGLKRFVDAPSTHLSLFTAMSGPWPRSAWTSERLGPVTDGAVGLRVYTWTEAGWTHGTSFALTDGYWFAGAGAWTDGRIIMPVIRTRWEQGGRPRLAEKPRFRVLSGPPAKELPSLKEDPELYPCAFASLPSGHAFLAYSEHGDSDLVVHRWEPGQRQPVEHKIPGVNADKSVDANDEGFWWESDPTRKILAVAPDEVYVAGFGESPLPSGELVIAEFDGRRWQTSVFPSEQPFIGFARGPEKSLWAVFSGMFYRQHPDGELLRKLPGGEAKRVALPPIHVGGEVVEVAPVDVWPRGADEVWIIALYGPRAENGPEVKRTKYAYGLFLLKPSALEAAGPH